MFFNAENPAAEYARNIISTVITAYETTAETASVDDDIPFAAKPREHPLKKNTADEITQGKDVNPEKKRIRHSATVDEHKQ